MIARVSTGWMALAAWLIFCVLAVWLTAQHGGVSLDTDSAMRLAGVRDLLAGQGWFDTVQHRMNTPFGLAMHWSRLADLGPALLLLLLRPLLGPGRAETVMLYLWPLLTFLPVLAALARIAAHLAGRAAAVIVLPLALLAVEIYGLFAPGSIDHHNLQAGLTLWTLIFLIERRPIPAAIAVAVSLAIGLETLPYAIAAIVTGCLWLRDDDDKAGAFGLALAAASCLLLFGFTARAYWFAPACEEYSEFYAALLIAGGAGLALVSLLPRRRLPAFALLTAGVLVLGWSLNKGCFGGPYAGMDAPMQAIFLSRINEARPAFDFMHFAPSEFVAGYGYAAFAFAAALFLPRDRRVGLVAMFGLLALAAAALEFREVNFALLLTLPGLAAMLATYLLPYGVVPVALAILFFSDAGFALAGAQIEGSAQQAARIAAFNRQVGCAEPSALAPLAALPSGRVAGFVDQGPAILVHTRHAAIAGPYPEIGVAPPHAMMAAPYLRESDGIADTYAIFTGAPEVARAILQRRGIHYLMACSAAPDWRFYIAQAPEGLLARLARHQAPEWLSPSGRAGDVIVWRVK